MNESEEKEEEEEDDDRDGCKRGSCPVYSH